MSKIRTFIAFFIIFSALDLSANLQENSNQNSQNLSQISSENLQENPQSSNQDLNQISSENSQKNSQNLSQNLTQNSQILQENSQPTSPQNTAIFSVFKDTNLSEIYDLNDTKNSQTKAKLEAFLMEKCPANACQNAPSDTSDLKSYKRYKGEDKYDFAAIFMQDYDTESYDFMGIRAHDTNYFLPFSYNFARVKEGEQHIEVKFQISIKKAIFENLLGLNETWNFGYTQRAWWQLYATSAPFRELNYAPEAFLSFPLRGFGWLRTLNIGILHQSNGKDGLNSRSWNRIYTSFMFAKSRFIALAKVWYILPEKDNDNPDIRHYMGNFDLRLGYLGRDIFAHLLLRNNLNFKENTNSVQLDVGYDIFNNGIFWYLQYFNGYGESLIDYNRHANRLSLGFLIAY